MFREDSEVAFEQRSRNGEVMSVVRADGGGRGGWGSGMEGEGLAPTCLACLRT